MNVVLYEPELISESNEMIFLQVSLSSGEIVSLF